MFTNKFFLYILSIAKNSCFIIFGKSWIVSHECQTD